MKILLLLVFPLLVALLITASYQLAKLWKETTYGYTPSNKRRSRSKGIKYLP